MDPAAMHMDYVISKLDEANMSSPWKGTMGSLKEELVRLRACYRSLADAPSWYILQEYGKTSLSPIGDAFFLAEKFLNSGSGGDEGLRELTNLRDMARREFFGYKDDRYEDKEETIFGATRLPMDPTGAAMVCVRSVFSKLGELLKEDCKMMPTTTKVEELKSMAKQLAYLQQGFRMPFNQLRGPDSVWLCLTIKLFYEAKNLIDTLVVPRGTLQITDVEIEIIKKITQRASLHFQLLDFRKGSRIRALYKHEQEADLVGIDGPRDELLKMLAEKDGMPVEKNMKGVIIVGEEGSGKTTLARLIYHHLKPHFDCAAFVTTSASDDGPLEFFTEMASQLDLCGSSELIKFLQDKRYLVVIDDVCSVSALHNPIFSRLPNNDYGSRVIAICQTYDMCDIRWDKSVYEVQPLGHLDSEKLFLKQLVGSEASFPNACTNVIKEILRMCGHNPSAIISIASVLATKVSTTKPWQEVMDSVYSDWKQMARSDYIHDIEDSRYILSLIYMHLPRPLNTCLLHLAVHGKNQIIRRTAMANKWVAEGFIHSCQTCNGENLASMCFDALIRRNLIQLVEYGNYVGEEIYEVNYMMHNVLRKLAHRLSFADVFSGQGCISLSDTQCDRLVVQYSGSELSIQMKRINGVIPSYRSITIVGPVKIYFDCDPANLLFLDMDGCKGLDNSTMDRICGMINLRYLSIKHTQVTEITPKIRELQCLETLDIRQTEISNLPPEIGTLQKLKTLDARQTQVEELPREIVQLPKLAHLYFGQISSLRGVKLPVGSDQLKSVKVFGTVDSREWLGTAMDKISGLTGVREIEVVLHDQPGDKEQNDKLLSSIGKCENLECLIIHGDYNPSDKLPVAPYCPLLERLKVAGRFVKVPRWIALLTTLKQLYVRVCKLDQDDLKILGGLPVLSTLTLSLISILRKKRVTISSRLHSSICTDLHSLEETCPAGFTSLEVFNFDCHVPWITFEQGAMPRLTHLHLKLFPCPADKFPAGIINLPSLEKIILRYSSHHASSRGVTNAVASMREEASSHANLIDISINGDHEVFPSITRVDEAVTGTKIEEDSEHDNQMELSVNGNHEVLDSRVNETVTGTETEEASNHGNRIEPSVDGDREVLLSNTRVDETIAGTEIKECY